MQRFRSSNFSNIQTMFHEKSGVDTKPHTKRHKAQKTLALLLVVLLSGFSLSAFGYAKFSTLAGDELSLYSVYRGEGVVEIHVENRSSTDLKFQPQLKLMRWVGAQELPADGTVDFENTNFPAGSSGIMRIDLSDAYDIAMLEEPLQDDYYYFVLTNNNFLFGQDWMCSVFFAQPMISPTEPIQPISPQQAGTALTAQIEPGLQHYFEQETITDPMARNQMVDAYFADCAQLIQNADGHVVSAVSPLLLIDDSDDLIYDENVPLHMQRGLMGLHQNLLDGFNIPVGGSYDEHALVVWGCIPQNKGDMDGGRAIPLSFIFTYQKSDIESAEDLVFIRGRFLTFAQLEEHKVYEDSEFVSYEVTHLFYSDRDAYIAAMLAQNPDVYFDESIKRRLYNMMDIYTDNERLSEMLYIYEMQ
ncbi:MAG: hypothetical protein J6L88_05475 [Clostridia bacterium]|nr:hypothetical protein [Clostridia bacterium]